MKKMQAYNDLKIDMTAFYNIKHMKFVKYLCVVKTTGGKAWDGLLTYCLKEICKRMNVYRNLTIVWHSSNDWSACGKTMCGITPSKSKS